MYFGTSDTRACFALVSEALLRQDNKKVVLILHSQGGLEGSIIVDWLIDQHPRDIMQKLEVYTFGNAANHFNNPRIRRFKTGDSSSEKRRRTIRHIEHYANSKDFVSRWGVLHFKRETALQHSRGIINGLKAIVMSDQTETKLKRRSTDSDVYGYTELQASWNSYHGAVFERVGSGHQFNQHYLDNMFPLDESMRRVKQLSDGSPLKGTFMDTEVKVHNEPTEDKTAVNGNNAVGDQVGVRKVYQLSRLWQYTNGRDPTD
jgi:hypothetical protein